MPLCNRDTLPASPGSYILWLKLNRKRRISIGRLGEHLFHPGYYAYCGSAFGPGGLKARLAHHLRRSESPRWHIDYLKNISVCSEIWLTTEPGNCEHRFSGFLLKQSGSEMPVSGFGASDCSCPTHLLFFPEQPDFPFFENLRRDIKVTRLTLQK